MKCIIKFVDDEDTTITINDLITIRIKDHSIHFLFLNHKIAVDIYESLPYYIKSNYKVSVVCNLIYTSLDNIADLIIKQS